MKCSGFQLQVSSLMEVCLLKLMSYSLPCFIPVLVLSSARLLLALIFPPLLHYVICLCVFSSLSSVTEACGPL